jgi:hypothetical protein
MTEFVFEVVAKTLDTVEVAAESFCCLMTMTKLLLVVVPSLSTS